MIEENKDEGDLVQKSEIAQNEERVLEFWNKSNTFKKSEEKDASNGSFVFYDGPPFATGTPHFGHILAGTIKDAIPRYQTMKGKKVIRKWGWDCHGLPVELAVEKELGFTGKTDIEKYGVAEFNAKCRESVLRNVNDFTTMTSRMGYWVDFDKAYWTMNPSYVESVWGSLKEIHKKGLLVIQRLLFCPKYQ